MRRGSYTAATRACKARVLRQILRWLWEYHGAPKLDGEVRRYPPPRPRNVTATDDERAALLAAAPPHLRLWLLFCSDLAIRSGTAIELGAAHYDARQRTITFTTKCDEHLTLPVTEAIAELIAWCHQDDPTSYVRQLWRENNRNKKAPGCQDPTLYSSLSLAFLRLRRACGITRKLTPHDLRRTTAVAMYNLTGDVREVQAILGHKNLQSTIWYLDHDLRPVKRANLELIKRPDWRKENIA